MADFRSPTGLYSVQKQEDMLEHENLKSKYKLSALGDVFNPGVFLSDPSPFYAVVKKVFYPVVQGIYKLVLQEEIEGKKERKKLIVLLFHL